MKAIDSPAFFCYIFCSRNMVRKAGRQRLQLPPEADHEKRTEHR